MHPVRPTRAMGAVAVVAVAVGLFFRTGAGFGELPEYGTGSSFMTSLGPWLQLLLWGPVITTVATAALVALVGPSAGSSVAVALVLLEAVAAALGASWSYADHDCARYWPDDHALEAAWTVAISSGIAAAIVLGVAALLGRSRARNRPSWTAPVGMRRIGLYEVRSIAPDVARGSLRAGGRVWVAVDDDRVLFQAVAPASGPEPPAWSLPREGIQVDQLGWATSLWAGGRLLLELDPAGVGSQYELLVALSEVPA